MEKKQKQLLTGNQAIARGAYEAGCQFAFGYPGTPSSEIIDEFSRFSVSHCEWSVNEKIALEAGIGVSLSGKKAIVVMKHVGLNVAADPFFAAGYLEIGGGLVIVSCDDPGAHSSHNEQDNRFYAEAAKIPMLEPSDSQEAKDFTKLAFTLSQKFRIPVLLRTTTRISHSQSIVALGEVKRAYSLKKKPTLYKQLLLPTESVKRHEQLLKKIEKIRVISDTFRFNRIEWGTRKTGIITSGVAYQYTKEVFSDQSILKLSLTHPLPEELIRDFSKKVSNVVVIEEGDPFLEKNVNALGVKTIEKGKLPQVGEFNQEILRQSFGICKKKEHSRQSHNILPMLCAGCPHRSTLYLLKKIDVVIAGDIGCYGLGAFSPWDIMDTCASMGTSINFAYGIGLVFAGNRKNKIFALLGDSTFFHSGIPSLLNAVSHNFPIKVIILDNQETAMTGHQPNAGSIKNPRFKKSRQVKIENLIRACGIKKLYNAKAYDIKKLKDSIKKMLHSNLASVLVVRGACRMKVKPIVKARIDSNRCKKCKSCLSIYCPAITYHLGNIKINRSICKGCGLCVQVCQYQAISLKRNLTKR